MTFCRLQNSSRRLKTPVKVELCLTFGKKLKGLMFAPSIGEYDGIMFVEKTPSRINTAIHMLFMNFDIAVIWLDEHRTVVDKALARKWRPAYAPSRPALYVLEAHPARLDDFSIGDVLHWE